MAEPSVKWANNKIEGPAGPGLEEVKTLQQPTGPKGQLENVPAGPKETPSLKSGSSEVDVIINKTKSEQSLEKAHKNAENLAKEVGSIPYPSGEVRKRAVQTKRNKNSRNLFGKNSQKYPGSTEVTQTPLNNLTNTQELTPNISPNTELNSTSELIPVINTKETNTAVVPLKEGLPTLLRFGPYDTSSEYIELDGKKFKSTSFDMFGLGIGRSEMTTLYGITNVEHLAVLQKVFGVPSLGKKPLFVEYYTKECDFPGKDIVLNALQTRVNSINLQMEKETEGSNTHNRLKHQYEWIYETISKLQTFTTPCDNNTSTKTNASTNTNNLLGKNASISSLLTKSPSANCPCLTEINLLRDLVVLVALIQGNASETMKQKMRNIPLNRLLNAVKSNKPSNVSGIMKEVLAQLLEHLKNVQSSPSTNTPNPALLLQIYNILKPEDTNRQTITLPEIKQILHTMMIQLNKCDAAKTNLVELENELAEVRAELETLKEQESNFIVPGINTSELQIKLEEEQKALELAEKTRHEVEVKLATLEGEKQLQGSELEQLKTKLAGEIAAAEEKERLHKQSIVDLTTDIDTMNLRLDELLDLLLKHREELTSSEKELEAITEALVEEKSQHETTNKEKEALQIEYDGLVTTIDDLNKKGASNKGASNVLSAELEKNKVQLETLREQLETKTAEESRLREEIAKAEQNRLGLNDRIKSLEHQIEIKNARIVELEEQQKSSSGSADKIASLEAQITELTEQLKVKMTEYGEASAALQTEVSGMKSREAACSAELESLKKGLPELQEKAGRTNIAERTLTTVREELNEAKTSLHECTEDNKRKQTSLDEDLVRLRKQLEDTEESMRRLEDESRMQKNTNTSDKTQLSDQLAQAKSRIETQEREIAALQSKGGEANSEYEKAKSGLESRISDLEEQLASLQTSSAEEKSKAIGEEQKKCEERVKSLQEQLTYLQEQVATAKAEGEKAKTNAQSTIATATLEKEESTKELQRRIDELTASIETMKGELATANASLVSATTAKASSDSELQGALASLATAKANIETQKQRANTAETSSKSKNAIIAEQKTEIDRLTVETSSGPKQSDLDEAKTTIEELQSKLGVLDDLQKEKSDLDNTKQRLTNILTAIAISPEQKNAVAKILKGDEADLAPFYKTLDKETCDFFHYLYDTINIQLRILEEMPVLRANEGLMTNIFSMYTTVEENKSVLLEELTRLFQEFFTKFNAKTGIPGQGINMQENYPELEKLFGNNMAYSVGIPVQTKLRDDLKQISDTLKNGGFRSMEKKIITMKQSFPSELDGTIPLSVLAIKLIQLLHETFEGKFKELKKRCDVEPKEDGTENTEGLK